MGQLFWKRGVLFGQLFLFCHNLDNYFVDNLWDNHDLQRKNRYLHENQSNGEIK